MATNLVIGHWKAALLKTRSSMTVMASKKKKQQKKLKSLEKQPRPNLPILNLAGVQDGVGSRSAFYT